MTVRQLRELLLKKPPLLTQEEFDEMEVIGLTDNGIEEVSENEDTGVRMMETEDGYHAFVFSIPLESSETHFEEEEEENDTSKMNHNALPELMYLAELDSTVNLN